MNFLAHLYLSGNSDEIKFGNFIADSVKGRDFSQFTKLMQQGIVMHRDIDDFTDKHPLIQQGKERIKSFYKRHSGIAVDIFYDHFLASQWSVWSNESLRSYVQHFYMFLVSNYFLLPPRAKMFMPFLVVNNWLLSYVSIQGIESVLHRMTFRTSMPEQSHAAATVLYDYYEDYRSEFNLFFPDVIGYIENKYNVRIAKSGI